MTSEIQSVNSNNGIPGRPLNASMKLNTPVAKLVVYDDLFFQR